MTQSNTNGPSKTLIVLSCLAVALATAWLYRRAPGFAYFNDDPTGHFAWMEGRTLLSFFISSAEYGYYRPVVFAVLRGMQQLSGGHNPVADHTLLLALHAANAALVWLLAYVLARRPLFAWVAALLFATVPFSYEAVGYVASLTHPLLVFWLLLTLLCYARGRATGRLTWYVLALLTTVGGLLTHENGLFIFPALVGLEWVTARPSRIRDLFPRPLPYFLIPTALYAVVWLAIPKDSQQVLNGLGDIGRNLVPFLQTLVYPLLPVVRIAAENVAALALTSLAFVAAVGWLAWRAEAARLWFYAVGWFLLSALPALLFLEPAYVYGSPRLSYLPSIGVALLWAIPILWLAYRLATGDAATASSRLRSRPVGVALAGLYTLAIALPARPFIECQLDFYEETSRIARDMGRAAAAAPEDRPLLFINLPFFFSSYDRHPDGCPGPYPWTPVGGILIPPYAQAADFVRFNGGPARDVSGASFGGYEPGWRTYGPEISADELRAVVATSEVYAFDLNQGGLGNVSTAWRPGVTALTTPIVTYGNLLALTSLDVAPGQDADALAVDLGWQVLGQTDAPLAVFVHLYDAQGVLVAQIDGPPGSGLAPQTAWQPGDLLYDPGTLDITGLPPGTYTLGIGVYDASSGVRLAAVADEAPADDMLRRPLQLP